MEWNRRKVVGGRQSVLGSVAGRKPRATWAAVLFALASLVVDLSGWVRADLKPLMELARENSASLKRIETKLEDHERRIQELERRRK
jgi:hypothetical protein